MWISATISTISQTTARAERTSLEVGGKPTSAIARRGAPGFAFHAGINAGLLSRRLGSGTKTGILSTK